MIIGAGKFQSRAVNVHVLHLEDCRGVEMSDVVGFNFVGAKFSSVGDRRNWLAEALGPFCQCGAQT